MVLADCDPVGKFAAIGRESAHGATDGWPVGAHNTMSETGSLGGASRACGAGAGDGITAGSAGWFTLHLAPGRYELVCNLPGHYAAGMYAPLTVS